MFKYISVKVRHAAASEAGINGCNGYSRCSSCRSIISSHSNPQFLHLVICDERNPAQPQLTSAAPLSTSRFISGITSDFADTTLTRLSEPHLKHIFIKTHTSPKDSICPQYKIYGICVEIVRKVRVNALLPLISYRKCAIMYWMY